MCCYQLEQTHDLLAMAHGLEIMVFKAVLTKLEAPTVKQPQETRVVLTSPICETENVGIWSQLKSLKTCTIKIEKGGGSFKRKSLADTSGQRVKLNAPSIDKNSEISQLLNVLCTAE